MVLSTDGNNWPINIVLVRRMMDILVKRNEKAIKEAEAQLNKLLSVETNNIPEQYLDSLFIKIEKLIDYLSALNRRGGYYEFKKSNNNK